MNSIRIVLLIFAGYQSFGQEVEATKWIKRGSIEIENLTAFAASKYIVPDGDLKYDSSYYYEGEFVVLADRFDETSFNNNSFVDIFEFDDEKCILEDRLKFLDLTRNFPLQSGTKIVLLPIHVCSDYITGLTFEISDAGIKKLFELDMYFEPRIEVSKLVGQKYSLKYKSDEGFKSVVFDFESKTIANKR